MSRSLLLVLAALGNKFGTVAAPLRRGRGLYGRPRRSILSDVALPAPKIPAIIHQSYRSTNLSSWKVSWLLSLNSWTLQNPSWQYMFWLDADNRRLFEQHVPKYLQKYDGFATAISKADYSRFAYLYVHGGVYADLDVEWSHFANGVSLRTWWHGVTTSVMIAVPPKTPTSGVFPAATCCECKHL